jgi:outer membrane protein OmpA-like peptidoglycan-associated protein
MKARIFKLALPFYLILVLLCPPNELMAQVTSENRANQYFENFAYSKAVEIYEELHKDDLTNPFYIERLAHSYHKMLSYSNALKYYGLLVQQKLHKPADIYEYAELLRSADKQEEYKIWLEKYHLEAPNDKRATTELENSVLLSKLGSNIRDITLKNLPGNTRFIDMCPVFYRDQIVYSSAKDSFTMIKGNYEWNNQPFLDLYVSKASANPDFTKDEKFSRALNSRVHEGPVCFTKDFNTIYFTRNTFIHSKIDKKNHGVNNLKIYIATDNGYKWGNIHELTFNSNDYSVGHPALSSDDKTLYFISDMPGGYGETDIYKSSWDGTSWSKPVNLGESINTAGKEMFPFVDKDGILYFSTNGRDGLGGLDVFAAKEQSNGTYLITNMGAPINSVFDDFGFVINKDSLTGFLTSNRTGGKGDDDNYSFTVNKIELTTTAYDDQNKKTLPKTKISLLKENGVQLESKITDKDGKVDFLLDPKKEYYIQAENKSYDPKNIKLKDEQSAFNFKKDEGLYLKIKAPYLKIQITDKATGGVISDGIVNVIEGSYDMKDFESKNGSIRMKLNDSTNYTLNATALNYFENTVNYSSTGKSPGNYDLKIELEKVTAGKELMIYYDLNKTYIRPKDAAVLNKLIKFLLKNPTVNIKVASHTDSRASVFYNQHLSEERSKSVLKYLSQRGILLGRVQVKDYGKTRLVNQCADGVKCPEEQHQANRRTVIEIIP